MTPPDRAADSGFEPTELPGVPGLPPGDRRAALAHAVGWLLSQPSTAEVMFPDEEIAALLDSDLA